MNKFFLLLISWPIFFAIDMFWIRVIMRNFYHNQMQQFFRFEMHAVHQVVGSFVWFLLVLGLIYFVLPQANSLYTALLGGLVFGLVVYGVYDLTNFVVINHWSLTLMLVDLAWGCLVNSLMAGLIFLLNQNY
jgi:uncharacterized membrane protein